VTELGFISAAQAGQGPRATMARKTTDWHRWGHVVVGERSRRGADRRKI